MFAGKGLPDVRTILKHLKDAFDWVEANNSGRIIPHEGGDIEYDSACKMVKEIESSFVKHLKEQRKLLGNASVRTCLEMFRCSIFPVLFFQFYMFKIFFFLILQCVTDHVCYSWERSLLVRGTRKSAWDCSSGL